MRSDSLGIKRKEWTRQELRAYLHDSAVDGEVLDVKGMKLTPGDVQFRIDAADAQFVAHRYDDPSRRFFQGALPALYTGICMVLVKPTFGVSLLFIPVSYAVVEFWPQNKLLFDEYAYEREYLRKRNIQVIELTEKDREMLDQLQQDEEKVAPRRNPLCDAPSITCDVPCSLM